MKINITKKELKAGTTLLAFDSNNEGSIEIKLFYNKLFSKFGVLRNCLLIKSDKNFVPCLYEFKIQIKENDLNIIKKFENN